MGVFGSSDGDQNKKLEADVAFIKTRLDLIARQLASGQLGDSKASNPDLDAKLHAIYRAISNVQSAQQRFGSQLENAPVPNAPSGPITLEGLDELRADVRQLLQKSDRSMHLDLTQRLDGIDARLDTQERTMSELTAALRALIAEFGKR